MRWALGLEYDGSAYYGWQNQQTLALPKTTVQQRVELALSCVADQPITAVCAGRTDKGVHALGQIVHFDTEVEREERAWVMGVNRYLPADIRVLWAKPMADEFHARFSAIGRCYHYIIYNHPIASAVWRNRVSRFPDALDVDKMQQAADFLLGEHDFSAFRGADCQAKTAIRNVEQLTVRRVGDYISIVIKANAFLHHMVRNIVGVLLEVGVGKRAPDWAQAVLHGRDRKLAGITAPPSGLYLVSVTYPPPWELPTLSAAQIFPILKIK